MNLYSYVTNDPINLFDPYGLFNFDEEFGDFIFRNTGRYIRKWISNNGDKVSPHIVKILLKGDSANARMKSINANRKLTKWQKRSLHILNVQDVVASYYIVGKAGQEGWFWGSKISSGWGYGMALTFAEIAAFLLDQVDFMYDVDIWTDLFEKYNEFMNEGGDFCEI